MSETARVAPTRRRTVSPGRIPAPAWAQLPGRRREEFPAAGTGKAAKYLALATPMVLGAGLGIVTSQGDLGSGPDASMWLHTKAAPSLGPADASDPDSAVLPVNGDPQRLVAAAPPGADTVPLVVPVGDRAVTGRLTASGIPVRALQAYLGAECALTTGRPGCHLRWSLLAGIARVESNHGRHGGAQLTAAGVVTPAIYGPRLNGTGGLPYIHDTDGGRLDADAVEDRAVGPMQFLPGTWTAFAGDADADGVANPQDLDDAALTAGNYLCAGGTDLGTVKGRWEAVYRYNHSGSYVNLVLALADSYAAGSPAAVAAPPPGASTRTSLPPATAGRVITTVPLPRATPPAPTRPVVTVPTVTPSAAPTAVPSTAPPATATPSQSASPLIGEPSPSTGVTATPTVAPTPEPSPSASAAPTGTPPVP